MEEALIKLGLNVYQVAGIIGVLVFFIALLVVLLLRFYSKRVSSQAGEIKAARDEVEKLRVEMKEDLQANLNDCENKCNEKDKLIDKMRNDMEELKRQVEIYKRNEIWMQNEIQSLEDRIANLEGDHDIQSTGSKRKSRRGS